MCEINYQAVLCPCTRGPVCPARTPGAIMLTVRSFAYHHQENTPPVPRMALSVACEERKKRVGVMAEPDLYCEHGVTTKVEVVHAPDLCEACEMDEFCVQARSHHPGAIF